MSEYLKPCANCGDPTRTQSNAVGERASLGYCVGCYAMWQKANRKQHSEDAAAKWLRENDPDRQKAS